jgi:hypothetical protein
MSPFFVGPMRAEEFLEHFLPDRPDPLDPSSQFRVGMFKDFIQILSEKESEWYDVFVSSDPVAHCRSISSYLPFQIKIISSRVPKLHIINTSNVTDKTLNKLPFDLKPDCSVYTNDKYKGKGLIFSLVDFIIEFKKGSDPFVDPESEPKSPENFNPEPAFSKEELNPFVCPTSSRLCNLGQITAYATSILSAQYRTHMFMVFIVKNYARLLRWDRGGAVVTEPIYFNDQPHLFDFFIRYHIADREARGHDSTVKLPNNDEIILAKAVVPELAEAKSFLAIDISDRRYIIQGPELRQGIPVGRWTRVSFAYDIEENCRVLLKDSWRVLLPDIQPEGEIYRLLHRRQVPNIPRCVLASDVDDDTHHRSRTHEVIDKCKTPQPCWDITPHRHSA